MRDSERTMDLKRFSRRIAFLRRLFQRSEFMRKGMQCFIVKCALSDDMLESFRKRCVLSANYLRFPRTCSLKHS